MTRTPAQLGLPDGIEACLFDLDGVITDTASVHLAAWKETFDELLQARADAGDEAFRAFTPADYAAHVDGKPRAAGVRDFLASRGITLPETGVGETVESVGSRKNARVLQHIDEGRVEVFPGSVRYLEAVRDAGLRTAVVSSSANCEAVVRAVGLEHLLEARVDGVTAVRDGLPGKPAPDMFLAGAAAVGVAPGRAAVVEDAIVGVAAGRAGRFGTVVGVDRVGQADALREAGADVVVTDLADLLQEVVA